MLKKLNEIKNREEGFTIIEVLIVLAIAALILVIVLVAIPQLQRNQRNTARKGDVGRVGTAVNDWMSSNNGQSITSGNAAAQLAAITRIQTDLGNLSQYKFITPTSTTIVYDNTKSDILSLATGAQSALTADVTNVGNVRIVTGATCTTSTGAAAAGTSRNVTIQYVVESGSGYAPACIEL